jgi:hypothetical protein
VRAVPCGRDNAPVVLGGKVFPKEDGTPTPRWRTADLYFADYDTAVTAFEGEKGLAFARDAFDIATGGVEFLLSDVED